MLLPSEQSTQYGDWVKAGALKAGDKISTFTSVGAGPTIAKAEVFKRANGNRTADIADSESWAPDAKIAANDNGQSPVTDRLITESQLVDAGIPAANDNRPLTVLDILHDSNPTRVYNFEVESLPGEITHNYLVGPEQAWVHNVFLGKFGKWARSAIGGAIVWWSVATGAVEDIVDRRLEIEDCVTDRKRRIKRPFKLDPLLPGRDKRRLK